MVARAKPARVDKKERETVMRNAFSAITVPSTSTPGAAVSALNFGAAKSINYEGAQGDDIEFQISADGGTSYGVADGMRRVAGASGDFVIDTSLWFTHIRAAWRAGTGGGTAGITATPQATSVPFAEIEVLNTTTPGDYADCRSIGRGRTLVFTGTAGDKFYLEGSDNGSTHPVPIGTWTIAAGKTSFVITIANLSNYVRCTRLKGTTTATAAVAGEAVESSLTTVAVIDGTGTIGNADVTVDVGGVFEVAQTTTVTLYANMRTIPPPTATGIDGRVITVVNVGTAPFTIGDETLKQGVNLLPGNVPGATAATGLKGQGAQFEWNGSFWVVVSEPSPQTPVAGGLINATGSIPRLGRYTQYKVTNTAAAVVLTAPLTGALRGDEIEVTRTDTAANTVTINNNAAAALFVQPVSKVNFTVIRFTGTDWEFVAGGTQ